VFVGVFWGFLELGAELFRLIQLDFFGRLIEHRWFSIPATALATAAAIHVTDVRAGLVRGTRTLVLVLLSWLLPLLVLIVAGFLVSLPFTGLAVLWKFGHASGLLLTAAAFLIVLINAARQDGASLPPAVLRAAGSAAAVLLTPLTLLAGYGLALRVNQYGWTIDRVATAACVTVGVFYAAGYLLAALRPQAWLKGIERWNFLAALLILGVLLALFTPLAHPARVSVADQMARIQDGRTRHADIDYDYLRWSGGRYGGDALATLAHSRDVTIREAAMKALAAQTRDSQFQLTGRAMRTRTAVYPKGRTLPESFFRQADTSGAQMGGLAEMCLGTYDRGCDAVLADIDGDGRDEIVVMGDDQYSNEPLVFKDNGKGQWTQIGHIQIPYLCSDLRDALRAGHFATIPPQTTGRDILVSGRRLRFRPEDNGPECTK
jgi:hypothetical protein